MTVVHSTRSNHGLWGVHAQRKPVWEASATGSGQIFFAVRWELAQRSKLMEFTKARNVAEQKSTAVTQDCRSLRPTGLFWLGAARTVRVPNCICPCASSNSFGPCALGLLGLEHFGTTKESQWKVEKGSDKTPQGSDSLHHPWN